MNAELKDKILEEVKEKSYPNTPMTKLVVDFKDVKEILNSLTEDEQKNLCPKCEAPMEYKVYAGPQHGHAMRHLVCTECGYVSG